jgi:hypothetical protein
VFTNVYNEKVYCTNGAHTEVELLLNVVTIGSENRFISPMFNIIRGIVEEVLLPGSQNIISVNSQ